MVEAYALHDESRGFREGERIAKLSVYTLLGLGAVELAFSYVSGSISLFADGISSVADAIVSLFVWAGLRFATRKPTRRFQFGYYKVETLTAFLAAVSLVGVAVYILVRSFSQLASPPEIALPVLAMVILVAAGLISLYRALQMRRIANRYNLLSLKVDASNSIKDATSSFVAFVSVLGSSVGIEILDPIGGMVIAFYILTVSYVTIRESSLILLDAFHEPELSREIESLIKSNAHVRGIRDLRLRRAGPFIVGVLEVIVDGEITVKQMHIISGELESSIRRRIPALRSLTVKALPLE